MANIYRINFVRVRNIIFLRVRPMKIVSNVKTVKIVVIVVDVKIVRSARIVKIVMIV